MRERRRLIISRLIWQTDPQLLLAEQERRLAACAGAAQLSDAEAEDFLAAARYLDTTPLRKVVRQLRGARISFPPELACDHNRLVRHVLARWREPGFPAQFLRQTVPGEVETMLRLQRRKDVRELAGWIQRQGAPVVFGLMRHNGMADLIPELACALPHAEAEFGRALTIYGKLLLHRHLTDGGPAKQPSMWEQRKLARRLRLRDVQLHTMHHSIYRLRRERTALVAQLRELGRMNQAETSLLLTELDVLRLELDAADQKHAEALRRQAEHYADLLTAARAELTRIAADGAAALALRSAWLPVVGGNEHGGYGSVAVGTAGGRAPGAMGLGEGAAGC